MTQNGSLDSLDSQRHGLGEIDGAVLSINARNFFCHDNLEIKFNENINFIVGRNGSGKSAILSALVVGLGARAAATNRGNSLQSFIKKGASSAVIEIKIKNRSENAYKHDIYGDVISISRTINASGGSYYKIKNERGDVVSTKHEDVAMICSVHDIQVDNPICVLNQDDARNFHASDSKKKYALFRKATNMDVIESNYNKALNNCMKAERTLDKKKEAFTELEKELDQLKTKYEQLLSRDEIQKSLRNFQDEYYWSEIAELEIDYKQILKSNTRQKGKLENCIERCKNLEETFIQNSNAIKSIQKELAEISQETDSKNVEFKSAYSNFQETKLNWKKCLQLLQKKKEQIYREDAKVNDLTKEINIALNVNLASETENLQRSKSEIIAQIKEASARKDTIEHELSQIRNAILHQQNQYENIIQNRRNAQNSINQVKSQLNELNVRGDNSLAVYGSKMVDFVNAVKKAHSKGIFSELPRGPIGSYLKVRDKKWTGALEHIMGGLIRSFCVNNEDDSRKLFAIMNQVFQNESKPAVITSKFYNKVHNFTKNAVNAPSGYFSALQCLQIEDPVIANFLIDNLGMESILMVETHNEAVGFAAEISRVPHNCAKIVTLDSSEFYPMPNYRSYGGSGQHSKFLQVNTSDRKRYLQEELSKTEKEFKKFDIELNESTSSNKTLSTKESSLAVDLRKLSYGIQQREVKLTDIDANLKNMEGGHVKVLTEELNLAIQNLNDLRNEESEMAEEELRFRNEAKGAESIVNNMRTEKNSSEAKQIQLKERLDQEQLNIDRNKSEKVMAENIITQEKKRMEELSKKLETQSNIINEKTEAATQLCPRIENPRPKSVVITELKKIEAKLNSISKSGPSKQEIATLLIEKEGVHKSIYTSLKELSTLIEVVKKITQQHRHCALQIQSLVASRVQYCFQSILKLRNYSGSMDINNATGVLEIHCTGRDSPSVRLANTTSSLSGGERSYATVAFIMALWDCMELPFYFLDEFDVFMDNVNRKVTMELLIDHANENLNRQYVFLTPQDTSTLSASSTVTIHRLADPIRNKNAHR